MNNYEFITIVIALASIIVSAVLTFFSIKASNKSAKLLSRVMRENSRMTTSEHLSLYRIEAFYNAVAIKNLEFKIQDIQQKMKSASDEEKNTMATKLQQLQMNQYFMKIREAKLIRSDFTLQEDLSVLHTEYKMK